MMYQLLIAEVKGIQSYIFGSNRLKENIGASYLVEQATDAWSEQVIGDMDWYSNLPDRTRRIEEDDLDVEVLYKAGGNFVALFKSTDLAKEFTRALSLKVLLEAPGLRLNIWHEPFDWDKSSLAQAVGDMRREKLSARAQMYTHANVTPGLSITAQCKSTGLAASFRDKEQISAEVKAKRAAAPSSNEALKDKFGYNFEGSQHTYEFPSDIDRLIRHKGDSSVLGVVHADGDGIGALIKGIADMYKSADQNREYIKALRTFSDNLKEASKEALDRTIEHLVDILSADKELTEAYLTRDGGNEVITLPFRPLVFGGDDVTFLCAGEFAVPLTAYYLEQFSAATTTHLSEFVEIKDGNKQPITACGGVALVKVKYPFARAYELAEELTKSAKKTKKGSNANESYSYLDWHLALTGVSGTLSDIRQREYDTPHGNLTMRPYAVDAPDTHPSAWKPFKQLVEQFQKQAEESRAKLKGLREVLRQGPEATKRYLSIYALCLPQSNGAQETGWRDKTTPYFDALELMDDFVTLETAQQEAVR